MTATQYPKAVQRQIDAANEIAAQIAAQKAAQDTPAPVEQDAPAPVEQDAPAQEPVQEVAVQESVEQSPAVEPQQPQVAHTDEEQTFEQRYKTLQGLFNAEMPRLRAENRALVDRVKQLEAFVTQVSEQPQAAQRPAQAPAQSSLTQDDVDEYGDTIAVMKKVARDELSAKEAELAELRAAVAHLQTTLPGRVEQLHTEHTMTREQQFLTHLGQVVPDWTSLDKDPSFLEWLAQVDPMTGTQRHSHLLEARKSYDVGRIAEIIRIWRAQSVAPAVASSAKASTPTADTLDKQIAPGRGRVAAPTVPQEQPPITTSYIRKFYDDARFVRTEEDRAKRAIEDQRIAAAVRAGKVIRDS